MYMRWSLWAALVLLAAGVTVLHLRIHPLYLPANPNQINPSSLTAFLVALIDLILINLLFIYPNTSIYAYLFNGIFVIYATVLMANLSLHELALKPAPLGTWLFSSTLPDIAIA